MTQLQIEAKSTQNQVQLFLKYPPNPETSFNFILNLAIYQQNLQTKNQHLAYRQQFYSQQKSIIIKDLKYLTMYKLIIVYKFGIESNKQEKSKNIFVSTEAHIYQDNVPQGIEQEIGGNENFVKQNENKQMEKEQNEGQKFEKNKLKKKIPQSNKQLCNSELLIKTLAKCNHIGTQNKVHKYLLDGRNCRDLKQFMNKQQNRRQNIKQVINKGMLITQSKLLFADIYKYREGCTFFENDWFMGPFYSYDKNEQEAQK